MLVEQPDLVCEVLTLRCARPFSCLTVLGDAFRRERLQGLILRACSDKVQGLKAEGLS